MECLAVTLENLSEVQKIIDGVVDTRDDSYQICAIYYLLTGRKGAWIFHDGTCAVVVVVHPHRPDELIVFPELGPVGTFQLTPRLLTNFPFAGYRISVGRYTDNELGRLEGFLSPARDVALTTFADSAMDWVFPIRILSTAIAATTEGHAFQKVRNKVRRAKLHVSTSYVLGANNETVLHDLFSKWCRRMQQLHPSSMEEIQQYYQSVGDILLRHPQMLRGVYFATSEGPCGMTLWSVTKDNTANLYVNMSDPDIVGLSDLQIVTSAHIALKHGSEVLNVGGSEEGSLDRFKAKYLPQKSIALQSAYVAIRPGLVAA